MIIPSIYHNEKDLTLDLCPKCYNDTFYSDEQEINLNENEEFIIPILECKKCKIVFPSGYFGCRHALNDIINKSIIVLINGSRNSGKSVLGYYILEIAHKLNPSRSIVSFGFPSINVLPKWVECIDDFGFIDNDSIVLFDESALSFFARRYQTKINEVISKLLAISRHKNLSSIFLTQNIGLIDINIVRLCDTLIFKKPSLLQIELERSNIGDLVYKANIWFTLFGEDKQVFNYMQHDKGEGVFINTIPKFWTDEISKSWKDVSILEYDSLNLKKETLNKKKKKKDINSLLFTDFEPKLSELKEM